MLFRSEEGSMGMLFVETEYRNLGIAMSLESYVINLIKEKRQIPYCQIYEDNIASIKLQEKLGLYLSTCYVWWLCK